MANNITRAQHIFLRQMIRENLLPQGQRQITDRRMQEDFRADLAVRSVNMLGHKTTAQFVEAFRSQVATVTFLAGAGSRWTKSIPPSIDPSLPRCLAQVKDVTQPDGPNIPIGMYNLWAVAGLGTPFIVWGTHKELIQQMALQAGVSNAVYVPQLKPLGHGDAMKLVLPELGKDIKYILTNFGGDANSPDTVVASLAIFAALQKFDAKDRPFGLLPTAFLKDAKYPINIDYDGYPVSFGHSRLKGDGAPAAASAHTNVGIRIYERSALSAVMAYYMQYFINSEDGYRIPGNKENTFGLDNIDEFLARQKKLQLACIALPEEIVSSVKQYADIPGFLLSMKAILGIR